MTMLWTSDGSAMSINHGLDLINIPEPAAKHRVAWVTYSPDPKDENDPWLGAYPTEATAKKWLGSKLIVLRMIECTPGDEVEAALREKGLLP